MVKGIISLLVVILLSIGSLAAQENSERAQKAPQQKETVLSNGMRTRNGYSSPQSAYKAALREAQQANPGRNVAVRNLTQGEIKVNGDGSVSHYYNYSVVELPSAVVQKLIEATNSATRSIDDGNRFAVDNISITDGKTDKESIKSQLIDLLIGKGYKVVAKEQLSKLYNEQNNQQSGIYNSKTTVAGNNFSAAGFFISVRVTDAYVQVQVVNVSTGEYEGNVTLNL